MVASFTHPTPHILSLLSSHLPHSLPLLRRLQFTRFPGGISNHARILFAGESAPEEAAGRSNAAFVAAYVDLSRDRETEVWLYSSLESLRSAPSAEQSKVAGDQILALLRATGGLRHDFDAGPGEKHQQGAVMFGTLSEGVRRLVLDRGLAFPYCSLWDKMGVPARRAAGCGP